MESESADIAELAENLAPGTHPGLRTELPRGSGRAAVALVDARVQQEDFLDAILDPKTFARHGSISERLFFHIARLDDEKARNELIRIYNKVASPPHLRPLLPALITELETRRLGGMEWNELTDALKVEVPLKGYAITVVDANGYTDVLLDSDHSEKVAAAADIIRAFNGIAKRTGAVLLEPVVGDAGIFMTFNAGQQARLEAELDALHVPMNVQKLASRKHEDGSDKYPKDAQGEGRHFTFSRGTHSGQEGVKIIGFGGPDNRRGGVMVVGKARDEAEDLQKKVGPGQQKTNPLPTVEYVTPEWSANLPVPTTNTILMKTIEAILHMSSYPEAALANLLDDTDAEAPSAKLHPFYVVLQLDGGDSEKFWDELIREGTGSENIVVFKPVGSREVHLWSTDAQNNRDHPEKFLEPFNAFLRQIAKMAASADASIKLSLGQEQAIEILRLPDSFQIDVTGSVVVGTVRGISALKGRIGNSLLVNESACEVLGLRGVEMVTFYVKGKPYRGVLVALDQDGNMSLPEPLVGRDREIEKLQSFVDSLGVNGVSLRIHKPADEEDGGFGCSALLRATDRYAREIKNFTDEQIIHLGAGQTLFEELEAKIGHSIEELIQNPELVGVERILFWDPSSVTADEAAQMDRFLSAMIGAPIGLVHTDAYQFRPGVMMGDAYKGRELSGEVEAKLLTKDEAIELTYQTRADLEPEDRDRVSQLLDEWGLPLAPRALIHTFARAIVKVGGQLKLDDKTLNQIWAGELAHLLDAAQLTDVHRMAFGVIAEVGVPVSIEDLNGLAINLSWQKLVHHLVGQQLLVIHDEDPARFTLANPQLRGARLLARQHAANIRAHVMEKNFFRQEGINMDDEERCNIELEHALGNAKNCANAKTFELVEALGDYYLKTKKDFGAAYGVYQRFLDACLTYGIPYRALPAKLLHDLVWVLTQTSYSKDIEHAEAIMAATPMTPELLWRKEGRLPALLPTDRLPEVGEECDLKEALISLSDVSAQLDDLGVEDHHTLERTVRLGLGFDAAAKKARAEHADQPNLALGFEGLALSRMAYSSRLLTILAGRVKNKLRNEGLAVDIAEHARQAELATHRRLGALEIRLVDARGDSALDKEQKAEIYRCILDAYKYLSARPNETEMRKIERVYAEAASAYRELDRPMQSNELDAVDVAKNAAALHWERKLSLPHVFPSDAEVKPLNETPENIFITLAEHEDQVRAALKDSVRSSIQPLRLRLTFQLMNFLQLKMRHLLKFYRPGNERLFALLEKEYLQLEKDAARLKQVLEKKTLPRYYEGEVLPIRRAMDEMATALSQS